MSKKITFVIDFKESGLNHLYDGMKLTMMDKDTLEIKVKDVLEEGGMQAISEMSNAVAVLAGLYAILNGHADEIRKRMEIEYRKGLLL